MITFIIVLAVSYIFTYMLIPWFIPRLLKANISGKDMNKTPSPTIPEMGGFAIIGGFILAILIAIGISTFKLNVMHIDSQILLASLCTISIMAIIGIIDDLFLIKQHIKAMLPIFASLPLVSMSVGVRDMSLPFIGTIDFGLIYPFILVPLAITGASNAINMLAGFNGLEAGLGAVMCATIALASFYTGNANSAIIALAMLGALLAFLKYNWYPAKIFIGDIGTLSIGAVVATTVIIGNMEKIGIILILPFFLELYLKIRGKLKEQSWCKVKDGKLVCENRSEVYGLGRLVMHLSKGIEENKLVTILIAMEIIFGIIALVVFIPLAKHSPLW